MQAYPKGASPEQVPAQDSFISTSQLGGPKISCLHCLHCLHCLDRSLILLISESFSDIFRPPRLPTDQPRQAPLPLLSCTMGRCACHGQDTWSLACAFEGCFRDPYCLPLLGQAAVALDIVTIMIYIYLHDVPIESHTESNPE